MVTEAGKKRFPGSYGTPPFYDWFSIVETQREVEVLAEIHLPVPDNGEKRWRRLGVTPRSPLLTWYERGGAKRIYLAANLSVNDEVPIHQLAGLPSILATLHRRRDSVSHGPAFWQFFVPVMGRVLSALTTDVAKREEK